MSVDEHSSKPSAHALDYKQCRFLMWQQTVYTHDTFMLMSIILSVNAMYM